MLLKKIKILIADDHQLFIEGLKFVLKEEFQIDIAGFAVNGKDAINMCKVDKYDIVIMDINMPVIDGVEATREIKFIHPETKVIIVSMLSDLPTINRALAAGANGYILKNTGSNDLIQACKVVLKNQIYISESLKHLFSRDIENNNKTFSEYIHFSENIITPREKSVLKLIVEGFTNQQIADTLFISVKTADTHRKNMLAKLNLNNTASLVKFAIENKLI